MREIKFRGWEKELKEMVYEDELREHIEYDTNPVNAVNYIFNYDDYGYDYMQYTGLKDKNGKDIYEGDIVVGIRDDFGRPIDIKATIYYDNGAFRENYYGDCVNRHQDRDGIYLEVVGNVYENSELLKGD